MNQLFEKHFSFWKHLDNEDKNFLLQNSNIVHYQQGENVHCASNDCVGVLLIRSGELRTYMLSEDGREITLYQLGSGDVCILSASCVIKNITFDVHIDAEADSEVILINHTAFYKLQQKNLYVENFALKTAVDRFSDVMWAMEQILFMRIDQRLAAFLFDESLSLNADTINYTHEKIARRIGSAREVVSRMLKQFEKEGMITLIRGGVQIIDKDKLKRKI